MSIQLNRSRNNIRELNVRYQGRAVAPVGFYNELERFGVILDRSVLISIIPDSGSTFIGSLINQNGNVCSFDIDYEFTQYSKFDVELESEQCFKRPQHTKQKPWDDKVLAFELYNESYS
ncbi:hypothetical protein ACJJIK_04570 [Microbulbifer sp. ZKSA006]|uniref:hypothetical protein n=1 Tax=Microbulbifer sp. ZKSA006 TaxID=3243390 RepID=UPI0040396428